MDLYNLLLKHQSEIHNFDSLFKDAAAITDYGRVRNLTDRLANQFPTTTNNRYPGKVFTNHNYVKWAVLFHTVFDVPLHIFDLPDTATIAKKLKEKNQKEIRVSQLYAFKGLKKDRESAKQEYVETLNYFLSHFTESLFVYDYLQRQFHPSENYVEAYVRAHVDLYETIEAKLKKNPDLKYARVFVPPAKEANENITMISEDQLIKEVVAGLTFSEFEHVVNCLNDHPSFEDPQKTSHGFYIAQPTRLYHYALVNNGTYIMTEHFKYNSDQVLKPDILIIESGLKGLTELTEIYQRDFEKLTDKKRPKLGLATLKQTIDSLLEDDLGLKHVYLLEEKKALLH